MTENNIEPQRRMVAIVGRPNVGKSAIFNRLAGRRIAIVHEQSGVTRDRLIQEVAWDEDKFQLIDTGGLPAASGAKTGDIIESGILGQVEAAIEEAAVAVLVVDVTRGVAPMDEEVAETLRRSGKPVFLAANKADDDAKDGLASDFEGLGFPVFPVSALHNRGFGPLMDSVVRRLPDVENTTVTDPLKVVIVGRPNVGKSSYINRILRSERLITSDIPGTTRESVDIPFTIGKGDQARHYLLMDTAGIRRKGKIDNAVETFGKMRAERSVRRSDVAVLILDASREPGAMDKKIGDMILREGKGCIVVVNKWDLSPITQRKHAVMLAKRMPFMAYCPVVYASAKTGYNIRTTVEVIDDIAARIRSQIPTAVLNKAVQEAVETVQPPMVRGRPLRIKYAIHSASAPLEITLFTNKPCRIPVAYSAYLIKRIREKFGLYGIPIALRSRTSKRKRTA